MTLDKLPRDNKFNKWSGQKEDLPQYLENLLSWIERIYYDIVQRLNPTIQETEDLADGTTAIDHGTLTGRGDDDHTQYLKEKLSSGLAAEIPLHAHTSDAEAQKLDHGAALGGLDDNDHPQYLLSASAYAPPAINYIDLPIQAMVKTDHSRINDTIVVVGPRFYIDADESPVVSILDFGVSTGSADLETQTWYSTFRIPEHYVVGTDLTFKVAANCDEDGGTGPPATRTFDILAYRNSSYLEATTQGFRNYSGAAWAYNTDLCTTAPQDVNHHTPGANDMREYTYLSFTIDGDNANEPLAAGDLIMLIYHIELASTHITNDSHMYAHDFHVTCPGP